MTQPQPAKSKSNRWTIIRRRDWPDDHGALMGPHIVLPEPDDQLEVIEVMPVEEARRWVEAEAKDAFRQGLGDG